MISPLVHVMSEYVAILFWYCDFVALKQTMYLYLSESGLSNMDDMTSVFAFPNST